jgi:hypothetical protein
MSEFLIIVFTVMIVVLVVTITHYLDKPVHKSKHRELHH